MVIDISDCPALPDTRRAASITSRPSACSLSTLRSGTRAPARRSRRAASIDDPGSRPRPSASPASVPPRRWHSHARRWRSSSRSQLRGVGDRVGREAFELQRREQAVPHGGIEMGEDRLACRRRVGRRAAAHAVGQADRLHSLALVDVENFRALQDSEPYCFARHVPQALEFRFRRAAQVEFVPDAMRHLEQAHAQAIGLRAAVELQEARFNQRSEHTVDGALGESGGVGDFRKTERSLRVGHDVEQRQSAGQCLDPLDGGIDAARILLVGSRHCLNAASADHSNSRCFRPGMTSAGAGVHLTPLLYSICWISVSSQAGQNPPGENAVMIVKEARAWLVCMPFAEDILWGSGRRTGATRLIVRLTCEDGTQGWGETISLIDTVPAVLRNCVLPLAIGYSVAEAERFHRNVLGAGYYHHKRAAVMAICAVEMAMWDALGKIAGQPLHALWGGQYRDRVEASAYVFVKDPEAMKRTIGGFLDKGFKTFKVKIGVDPASDLIHRRERKAADRRPPTPRRRQRRMDARNRAPAAREARGLRPRLYRTAARAGRPPGPCRTAPLPDGSCRAGRERLYAGRRREHRSRICARMSCCSIRTRQGDCGRP